MEGFFPWRRKGLPERTPTAEGAAEGEGDEAGAGGLGPRSAPATGPAPAAGNGHRWARIGVYGEAAVEGGEMREGGEGRERDPGEGSRAPEKARGPEEDSRGPEESSRGTEEDSRESGAAFSFSHSERLEGQGAGVQEQGGAEGDGKLKLVAAAPCAPEDTLAWCCCPQERGRPLLFPARGKA